jgi:hypothetical protein
MTVSQRVHAKDHTRDVDVHAHVVTAHKTTTTLMEMGPETVEGNAKRGDVEDIPNQEALPFE